MIVKKVNSSVVCDAGGCKNKAEFSFSFYGDIVDMRLCSHCVNSLRLHLGKVNKEVKKND